MGVGPPAPSGVVVALVVLASLAAGAGAAGDRPSDPSTPAVLEQAGGDTATPDGTSGADSGPGATVEVTGDTADQVRVRVRGAARGTPVSVRLPSGIRGTGPGATLVTLRITSGGPSDFDVVARHAAEPPPDTSALADGTTQVGLAYVTFDHELADADVARVRLTVRVEEAALDAWGAHPDSVTLYRYEDGGWASYDTHRVGEFAGAVYVRATFHGLSRFAVGADRPVTPTGTGAPTTIVTATPTAAAGAPADDDPPAGGTVESRNGFGIVVLVVLGLYGVLFGVGYLGSGPLLRRYGSR